MCHKKVRKNSELPTPIENKEEYFSDFLKKRGVCKTKEEFCKIDRADYVEYKKNKKTYTKKYVHKINTPYYISYTTLFHCYILSSLRHQHIHIIILLEAITFGKKL